MMTMSSTLVETVSIDYEDFNESFLTCGTCLCMYDGAEHTPKLLPCSHTVCLQCLDRIVATFARDTGQFRCPICRELITIPQGGVQALPPSFLVNQLLDLMARQRREVIPKCSTHHSQELLFCETCDTVFCTLCTGGTHKPPPADPSSSSSSADPSSSSSSALDENKGSPSHTSSQNTADHTVIPFSIAIKRMSEILIYKANECRAKLTEANEIVNKEIHKLDHNADAAFEAVNARFQTVLEQVELKRQDVLEEVRRKRDDKRKVLDDQLKMIQGERSKVDTDVEAMQHQVEVRNITKTISDLNCKLDTVSTLSDPRENSYIEYVDNLPPSSTMSSNASREKALLKLLSDQLDSLGLIKTSKTFPSLCRATMDTAVAHLETVAHVTTMDYHGELQDGGGDPVRAEVVDDQGQQLDVRVCDRDDGTYDVRFTAHRPGTYCLKVLVFDDRPIKDCPLFFDVTEHNSPVVSFGATGTKDKGFVQPCNVTVDGRNYVYVIDTANSRIKRLTPSLDFDEHITNEGLLGRSVTGICMGGRDRDSLVCINWRTKTVTEMDLDGRTLLSFTHDKFKEPIDVAVDAHCPPAAEVAAEVAGAGALSLSAPDHQRILVADNGLCALLVFDSTGQLLQTIGARGSKPGQFKDITALCVTPSGDYVVADSRIQVFSREGKLLREIYPQGRGKGRFGGLTCDDQGFLLATRTEKGRSFVQVFRLDTGELYSVIDSHGCKLRRPTGLAVMGGGGGGGGDDEGERHHVVVADLGSDCVRKYRYY